LSGVDPIAMFDSALAALQSSLGGYFADPALPKAEERSAGAQRAPVAASNAKSSETEQWLDTATDRAARQREAERIDQALKDAFGAVEQLRAAIDMFIATIAPLGTSGAAAAAAAADFREMMRESAAEALHVEAQRRCAVVAGVQTSPQSGGEPARLQSVPSQMCAPLAR